MASIRFRRIGMELRRIREELDLTLDEAGILIDRSSSSLSKLETGQQGIRPSELAHILSSYRMADAELRERLLSLARQGRHKGWWQKYGTDLSPETMDLISLESDAVSIGLFELILVPGLLQTEDYARELINTGPFADDPERVQRLIDIRMKRQQILDKASPPKLWAIIDEAALQRQVGGPALMRGQLRRLFELSHVPHVILQVLPFSAGAHWGVTGAFKVLNVGEGGELQVVAVDSLTTISYREEPQELHSYAEAFDHLRATALPEADSRALIEGLMSKP